MTTRDDILKIHHKSGIPQAIASQEKIADIMVKFSCSTQGMAREIVSLMEEIEGYANLNSLHWKRGIELNNFWRAENPEERDLVINDFGEITLWAVETIKELKAKVSELEALLDVGGEKNVR